MSVEMVSFLQFDSFILTPAGRAVLSPPGSIGPAPKLSNCKNDTVRAAVRGAVRGPAVSGDRS
jgi:hypothetical protein